MLVNLKQWREYVPMNQSQVYAGTLRRGTPVSITTISNAELGKPISRVKAQAILDVLNEELLRRGKISEPLRLEDIEALKIA